MLKITLKAARINAGLTQKQAADYLGVSNKTLCAWESGNTMPQIHRIDALCELYGVTYDQISFYPDIRFKRSF